jgi:hypothetical protein
MKYFCDLEIEDKYTESIRLENLPYEEIGDPRKYVEQFYHIRDLKSALEMYDSDLEFVFEKENDKILSEQKYNLIVWEGCREWEKKDYDRFFAQEAMYLYENCIANEWYS